MRKVAIIGAGAAGMTAAITAASNGAEVVVLEHMDRVGKKILSTGNGRCNFTNTYQDRSCYHSDNESFPWKIIEKFNAEQIIKLFEELGVYAKNRNGYMYPYSDQASSVTEALKMELERLQIDVRLQTECTDIFPRKKGFTLQIVKDGTGSLKPMWPLGPRPSSCRSMPPTLWMMPLYLAQASTASGLVPSGR